MKRRSIVAANWKMNGNLSLINEMITGLNAIELAENVDVVVCPSFPYLASFTDIARRESLQKSIHLGSQNVSEHQSGAYTGEISVDMLKECAVQYVIVGHSERRDIYQESSTLVAEKVACVLNAGLTPILCIGESESERENEQTNVVLSAQLQSVIDNIGIEKFDDVVIAYEPVWAIGTGKTASPEMAQQTHQFIREFLALSNAEVANKVPLLYGGSVNASNCETLFAQPDIDGGLIGGASLKVDEFKVICSAAKG
ncbi:triose-phosphate isomerase [Colwellia sp. 1_MG-2023]|uniref:triose-phosphate isomerase n=1 Tax=Colwellia sp. 1_MG-2023 TaxID=3062649 RepID=UPI0026E33CE1|nr:triose-phosphate isomerase [Colwellia sp. 1_MG-2023]MDO6446422.1 triose-phosphate isomerase [Colwellia sp. 1_MG-2023]